ncbi:MAG: hypothetical protein HY720_07710, partial [Planctomycetes bacterium]|nr:hypothetical protein [Planctomycetota bacterium]
MKTIALLIGVGLLSGCVAPASVPPQPEPPEGSAVRAYVTNFGGDGISVIDPYAGRLVGHVRTGSKPHGVAIAPDGEAVYVSNEGDGTVSVIDPATNRVTGRIDASGGIVFRARDGRNYYIVRANCLEDNFRLYTVRDGGRDQIASTRIEPPALGEWHTLRAVAVGPRIQAYLDGRLLIDHRDSRFRSGRVGLCTKADAVTAFDALTIRAGPRDSS